MIQNNEFLVFDLIGLLYTKLSILILLINSFLCPIIIKTLLKIWCEVGTISKQFGVCFDYFFPVNSWIVFFIHSFFILKHDRTLAENLVKFEQFMGNLEFVLIYFFPVNSWIVSVYTFIFIFKHHRTFANNLWWCLCLF